MFLRPLVLRLPELRPINTFELPIFLQPTFSPIKIFELPVFPICVVTLTPSCCAEPENLPIKIFLFPCDLVPAYGPMKILDDELVSCTPSPAKNPIFISPVDFKVEVSDCSDFPVKEIWLDT